MARVLALTLSALALAGCSVLPERTGAPRQTVQRSARPASIPADVGQCAAELGRQDARFTLVPDAYYGAGCSTVGAVQLSALRSDNASLALSNIGPVACPLATSFAAWARYGVDRAARLKLGSPLVRIETMGSYNCRTVAGSARMSAHATGNAIDVAGFVLADGRRIDVAGGWNGGTLAVREFLRIVHESACKRFGTVLGPDYNAAHQDHLHLESTGGGYCR